MNLKIFSLSLFSFLSLTVFSPDIANANETLGMIRRDEDVWAKNITCNPPGYLYLTEGNLKFKSVELCENMNAALKASPGGVKLDLYLNGKDEVVGFSLDNKNLVIINKAIN